MIRKLPITIISTILLTASSSHALDHAGAPGNSPERVKPFSETIDQISNTNDERLHALLIRANQMIHEQPNNEKLLAGRGQIHVDLGDYNSALKDFTAAIQANPREQLDYECRASVWGHLNNYQNEIDDIDLALKIGPAKASLLVMKSSALGKLTRFDEALKVVDEAIKLDSSLPLAWGVRGEIHLQLHDLLKAKTDVDRALELQPKNPDFLGLKKRIQAQR